MVLASIVPYSETRLIAAQMGYWSQTSQVLCWGRLYFRTDKALNVTKISPLSRRLDNQDKKVVAFVLSCTLSSSITIKQSTPLRIDCDEKWKGLCRRGSKLKWALYRLPLAVKCRTLMRSTKSGRDTDPGTSRYTVLPWTSGVIQNIIYNKREIIYKIIIFYIRV